MRTVLLLVFCFYLIGASAQVKKIDYSLKERKLPAGQNWYYALIRPINPAKDDYKGYCKYIVADVMKKKGPDVVVYIYDDKKAMDLNIRMNNAHAISKSDMQYVWKHIIAGYAGKMNQADMGVTDYVLTYYEEAEKSGPLGKFKGHEIYKP